MDMYTCIKTGGTVPLDSIVDAVLNGGVVADLICPTDKLLASNFDFSNAVGFAVVDAAGQTEAINKVDLANLKALAAKGADAQKGRVIASHGDGHQILTLSEANAQLDEQRTTIAHLQEVNRALIARLKDNASPTGKRC